MKGLRNKVILSGIVLMFAFIATIGSTYAWFTVSTESSVTDITLQVTAADNLLIKPRLYPNDTEVYDDLIDVVNYDTTISFDEMVTAGYFYDDPGANTIPWRLKPATILNGDAVTDDPQDGFFYINNIDSVRESTSGSPVAPIYDNANDNSNTGFYVTLQFWMLSQADEDKDIVLNSFSIGSTTGNSTAQANIQNATRLALWGDDTEHSVEAGVTPVVGNSFIFGRDIDYGYAIERSDESFETAPTPVGAPAVNTTAAAAGTIYTLQPNTPTLITVVIYIEGWDQHASNDIILANFDIEFSFAYAA